MKQGGVSASGRWSGAARHGKLGKVAEGVALATNSLGGMKRSAW